MKNKGIIITVIALLSVWAVFATITAVDNENRRSRLYDECEEQERTYEKLEKEYAELEDKYILHLAYEWLFDVIANKAYDAKKTQASLDDIAEREGLSLAEKNKVALYAQKILSKYGIETE